MALQVEAMHGRRNSADGDEKQTKRLSSKIQRRKIPLRGEST
jgi:hypothetical protein